MNEKVLLRAIPDSRARETEWHASSTEAVIGKDILELLSTSMYLDPMTIYREYVQNAADAIDSARVEGLLSATAAGKVEIALDATARSIRIRDNGTGIPWAQFAQRLTNLGASLKRGTAARGFRGVGRLAGLGYCQELIFRSRAEGENQISELRWDCRVLKASLRSARTDLHLLDLLRELVSVRRLPMAGHPGPFFEVELNGVVRHRNDRLLSPAAVREYLGQVAPVPFSPDFKYASDISAALRPYVNLGDLEIRINGAEERVYRPHRDVIDFGNGKRDEVDGLEIKELVDIDGRVGAIAWVVHHGYHGALPAKTLIKGIRLRTGNVQVGTETLLEDMFPETRFNSWAIGEVHVIDSKVLPNGRRDHFEQSVHFDNLLNQLTPVLREIAKRCRESSVGRKWLREFETHKLAALEKAKAVSRGGISKANRQAHIDSIAKSTKAMRQVVSTRHIGDETRSQLTVEADAAEARIAKLIGSSAVASDPLAQFKPQVRVAYQQMIGLIYECAGNSAAANILVEKILSRLRAKAAPIPKSGRQSKRR